MRVVDINQRTPEWHTWRRQGVSASETATILGHSPYKTPWRLWAELSGKVLPEDLSRNPLVQRGIATEDEARFDFEARHGAIVIPLCAESSEHPEIRASFDGIDDAGRPVELKVPADSTFEDVVNRRRGSDAYRLYWWQVQTQLYVAEASKAFLVFYKAPSVVVEFAIERDEAAIAQFVPAMLDFWKWSIQERKEPALDPARDIYIPSGADLDRWTELAGKYRHLAPIKADLEKQIKDLKTQIGGIEDDLVDMMGQFVFAQSAGVKVTRFTKFGSVDYKAALAVVRPDLNEDDLEPYRRSPSEEVRITVQKDANAAVPFDPAAVEAARIAAADQESFYF
jgi:putative phage-type endonuclease